MKTEVIKPDKKGNNDKNKSLLMPIIYLVLGSILAFKSNEAIKLLFYIIGIFIILYGIKSLIIYFKNKDSMQLKNVNLVLACGSILIGILLIVLSDTIELSIRYVLGFFLIYIGASRLLTQIGLDDYKNFSALSNILLIILGIFSIFVSNVVLVAIGWLLIINSFLLFIEYFKN